MTVGKAGARSHEGATPVAISSPLSAFGEVAVAGINPRCQTDAVYGVIPDEIETFVGTSGTATASAGEFVCTTGEDVGGYGVLRTRRAIRYRAGQAAGCRLTARFSSGVALCTQFAGAYNALDALGFGYNGTSFGICRRRGGALEIQTLTIATPAGGAETATITLNGTAKNVSLTAGTAAHNAYEIATAAGGYTGWDVTQNGSTVVFLALSDGDKSGTMSFSSTGVAAASFAETTAGAANVYNWTAQSAWTIDPMDGTGPSGVTLDPTSGNVYQIEWQYLGFGAITFSIENPSTGLLVPVHRIEYANANTTPSMANPSLNVGWFTFSAGSTTDVTVRGASACGYVRGDVRPFANPRGAFSSKSGISTTLTNLLTIRTRLTLNGAVNLREILPRIAHVESDSTKPIKAQVILGATLGGEPNWSYQDQSNSIAEVDTAGTTVTGGTVIGVLSAGQDLDLPDIRLLRGQTLTIAAAVTSGAAADFAAGLTWEED